MRRPGDDESRFWSKVAIGDGCWEWRGGRSLHGYGVFWLRGRLVGAHRVALALTLGKVAGHVLHACDNPACVRPSHLRVGTHAENMADCAAKGRGKRRRHGAAGQPARGAAKLSDQQVSEMRELYAAGSSIGSLAPRFGVRPQTVRNVVKGVTWRHVGGRS
jgi:hypothetical protein